MARIVYVLLSSGGIAGGQKMAIRHVETLHELGFDAVCHLGVGSTAPAWLEHRAPIEQGATIRDGDIVVIPEDSIHALQTAAASRSRVVVLAQNPYHFASSQGLDFIAGQADRFPCFLTVSQGLRGLLARLFPAAQVEVVRCFADERVFGPGAKELAVAYAPRKRPAEAAAIRALVRNLHPSTDDVGWMRIQDAREAVVALAMGRAKLFLSLNRLESVGMTTLEAMASGCVCAGFTGVGGREYATEDNGFWVADDDCVAAADALARAIDLVRAGGAPLRRMQDAARATARQWSYAAFRRELEEVWMRLAPDARVRSAAGGSR